MKRGDSSDRADPMMKRAADMELSGDAVGAIRMYRELLDRTPRVALAHLKLAILLHDTGEDYVGAVYHYRRYLELRPDTEKRRIIEGRLRDASMLFVNEVASPVHAGVRQDKAISIASQRPSATGREGAGATSSTKAEPGAVATEGAKSGPAAMDARRDGGERVTAGLYKVEQGDTLSSIAEDFYGDREKWVVIFNANRELLVNPNSVRAGMKLKIPGNGLEE